MTVNHKVPEAACASATARVCTYFVLSVWVIWLGRAAPLLPRGDQKAPRGRESPMMRRALAYLPGWRSLARTTPSEIPRIAT